jgi:adenylyl cyclase-associated protein
MEAMLSNNELIVIIRRLEAATSRLEDIASSTIAPPPAADIRPPNGTTAAPTPNPAAPSVAPPTPAVVKTAPPEESLPESVEGFDSFISGAVKKYVDISKKIGGVVADQVGAVRIGDMKKDISLPIDPRPRVYLKRSRDNEGLS